MRRDDPKLQRLVLAWCLRLEFGYAAGMLAGGWPVWNGWLPPELGAAIGACAFMVVLELTARLR